MMGWQWLAVLGMGLMECSYIPQLAKLYQMKEADEFSLLFPSMNFLGRLLAAAYSLSIHQYTLGFGFVFGMAIRFTLMMQVIYYRTYYKVRIVKRANVQKLQPAPAVERTNIAT